ncbi:unnamed protein product [Schistosoma haematobium]|nr:unnamed protein product [Schistosoma haematobium]CAH8553759.1 unnamed protein product [Schistosoma haematobium]
MYRLYTHTKHSFPFNLWTYYSIVRVLFSKYKKTYEILGNPVKRLAYDSVDPVVVDDSVPTISEIKSNFFTSLGNFFYRKSRWSKKQPTPHLGNSLTDIDEVLKFYDFCLLIVFLRQAFTLS